MIALTLGEIAAATGGRLDGGADPDTVVSDAVTLDSRAIEPGGLYVALAGERVDGHDFAAAAIEAGAVAALVSRPVGVPAILVEDTVVGLGLLARAVRERVDGLTVIAVTGSAGKTSTKDLLHAVVARAGRTMAPEGNNNNELGVPLTALRVDAQTRYLISEMGARGIGHIAYLCGLVRPDIGLVLNVGTAHAGAFGGKQAIAQGKGELVEALAKTGLAVLNADDPLVAAMASRTTARVVFTSTEPTNQNQDPPVMPPALARREVPPQSRPPAEPEIRAERINLDDQALDSFGLVTPAGTAPVSLRVVGEHQVANALAAAAVGIELGLSPTEVAQALSGAAAASRWRMEVRRRHDGLVVVNDAYNANPDSMAAALRALMAMSGGGAADGSETGRWAVLGFMVELGEASTAGHHGVGRLAVELGLTGLIAVGAGGAEIAEGVRRALAERPPTGSTCAPTVLIAADVAEARALVQQNVRRTDVVLVKASRVVGLERLAADVLTDSTDSAPTALTAPDPEEAR